MRVFGRRDGADAAAAHWVVRLGGEPLPEDDKRDFERWLTASAANRAAYDRACALWAELGSLPPAPELLARPATRPVMLLRAACVALVLVLAGLGGTVFWFGNPLTMAEADYHTLPGEQRIVTLSDGSQVQLDSASAMAVRFDKRERRVALLSGRAYFIVAPINTAERRPFVVAAAGGTAKALGTEFMVARQPGGATVTVVRHQVGVSAGAPNGGALAMAVLAAGQSVAYDHADGLGHPAPADLDATMAWRRGRLIFDDVPLGRVAAELNRYRHGRIVIVGEQLARRRVSGVFAIADLDGAIAAITRELSISSAALPPFVTLLY